MQKYDVVIIGSGQAGNPLAKAFSKAGKKVAIIERNKWGGSCVNFGCTPTKTMIASARVAYLAKRSADYGVETGDININMQRINQRKEEIVQKFSGGVEKGLENLDGVIKFLGHARFSGSKEIEIELIEGKKDAVTADLIFINTGVRPHIPSIKGLDDVKYLTASDILDLTEVPDHLIIIGGGYIGLEFAQMFRRFGSEVTVMEYNENFLQREDRDIAEEMKNILEEDGIKIRTGAKTETVKQNNSGEIELTYIIDDQEKKLKGSHVLISSGTQANTDDLGIENSGVETDDNGFVKVNKHLETNIKGIYALGDVKGGPAFTHISYDDFRIVRDNILEGGNETTDNRLVPYTMFTDPQLAHVGMHEKEAKEKGLNFKIAKLPMKHVARAIEMGETRGVMKAIVDADTEKIIGATILGVEGGEILSAIQIAMMGNLSYKVIKQGVFSHPTLIESLNNLFMTIDD